MWTWGVRSALAFLLGVIGLTSAAAASAAAVPLISITPATNLIDGEQVTVTGSGFATQSFELGLFECPSSNEDLGSCGSNSMQVAVGSSGAFAERFRVSRLIIVQSPEGSTSLDCGRQTCALRAIDLRNGQSASAALKFNARSRLQVSLSVDQGGAFDSGHQGVILHGALTCVKRMVVQLSGTLTQFQPPLTYRQPLFADPNHYLRLTCHPGAISWSATVSSWPGKLAMGGAAGLFTEGKATATVVASLPSTNAPIAQATADVNLQGKPEEGRPIYYLAMGESLAHGYAAPPGLGYSNNLLAHLRTDRPNLQLVELSCNDETTSQEIGGDACFYGSSAGGTRLTELQAAEAFLRRHRGSVALVTIDLGGVDLIRCSTAACVSRAETTLAPNLSTIIGGLRQAGGNIPIVGDNYFDPILAEWFNPSQRAYANASVPGLGAFNSFLTSTYQHLGVSVADIQGAFRTANTSSIASQWGKIPTDVYMICRYTDIPCPRTLIDADANAAGYRIFARAFSEVVDPLMRSTHR
jgi:lysophospholipase L1-like esterase